MFDRQSIPAAASRKWTLIFRLNIVCINSRPQSSASERYQDSWLYHYYNESNRHLQSFFYRNSSFSTCSELISNGQTEEILGVTARPPLSFSLHVSII